MTPSDPVSAGGPPRFATTSWTLVVDAGGSRSERSDQALAELLERYWPPLYAFARRKGKSPEDAQDLVQGFLASFLEKDSLRSACPARGRFRTFLLTSLDHFLTGEWKKARAKKRGGEAVTVPLRLDLDEAESGYSLEPSHDWTPEREFERRWAMTVLDRALERVAAQLAAEGRESEFEVLRPFLTGELERGAATEAAGKLGKTSGAFKVAVHRLRRVYGDALRAEVRETVEIPDEVDDEIHRLLEALRPPA